MFFLALYKMYTDVILLVVLIALIHDTPSVVASLSNTRLGKLLLICCTLALAVYRGRNAGVLSALVTVLLLHKGMREGLTPKGGEDAGTETVAEPKSESDDCSGNDCSDNVIKKDAEGDDSAAGKTINESASSVSKATEGFLGSGQICSVLASSRLSLEEALRSIGSNKIPASSARGNGGTTCPLGTICPQSTESVKCGFFS